MPRRPGRRDFSGPADQGPREVRRRLARDLRQRRPRVPPRVVPRAAPPSQVYRKYADGDAWKAGGRDGHFGADQYALERLFAASNVCEAKHAAYKLDFGYLPMNFNMRDPPSHHSCDWPLFGATHVIHHKHYVNGGTFAAAARRVDAVCDFLNAPATTPAFVVDKGAKTPRCGWM